MQSATCTTSTYRRQALATRVAELVGIAPEGVVITLAPGIFGLLCLPLGARWVGLAAIVAALATGFFFRDPPRLAADMGTVILSGADGKVIDIGEALLENLPGSRYWRVSVFMSLLNVHVNRAPVGGEVLAVEHTSGRFRAACRRDASRFNQRNLIVILDNAGRQHAMAQIAGCLARRIVCRLHVRDVIERGQRIGLIMFGSRVDHFIPFEYRVVVKLGQRVRAGESVIAELLPTRHPDDVRAGDKSQAII